MWGDALRTVGRSLEEAGHDRKVERWEWWRDVELVRVNP